jgi:hypothetical protein
MQLISAPFLQFPPLGQNFDGHVASEFAVVSLIHLTHTAFANCIGELIGTEFRARKNRHQAPVTMSGESIQPRGHSEEKSEATMSNPNKSAYQNVALGSCRADSHIPIIPFIRTWEALANQKVSLRRTC